MELNGTIGEVRTVVIETLHSRIAPTPTPSTPLLDSLPELDSMAVLELILALEERFDITIEDDDITAEMFETLGSLATFVDERRC